MLGEHRVDRRISDRGGGRVLREPVGGGHHEQQGDEDVSHDYQWLNRNSLLLRIPQNRSSTTSLFSAAGVSARTCTIDCFSASDGYRDKADKYASSTSLSSGAPVFRSRSTTLPAALSLSL